MASFVYRLLAGLLLGAACGEGGVVVSASDSEPASECDPACGDRDHCDPVDRRCYCDVGSFGDPKAGCCEHGDMCSEAAEIVGQGVCVHELVDPAVWDSMSIGSAQRAGWRKLGKYLAPADPLAPLPVIFNDADHYRLHYCMLKHGFAPLFPGFTHPKYNDFIYYRESRRMFAGNIVELSGDDFPVRFAFTVETPEDDHELITEPEAYAIFRQLQDRLQLGDLGYQPNSPAQEAAARSWTDPRVIVVLGGDEGITYEAYGTGPAYGRIRRYTSDQVGAAPGTFGWQDIVVLDSAPTSAPRPGTRSGRAACRVIAHQANAVVPSRGGLVGKVGTGPGSLLRCVLVRRGAPFSRRRSCAVLSWARSCPASAARCNAFLTRDRHAKRLLQHP